LAALWADFLFAFLLLLGVERMKIAPGITKVIPFDLEYYPYSHSLLALVLWAVIFGALACRAAGNRAGIVIGACILSHWFLDALVHRPDLPLTFRGTSRVGLGAWNSVAATLVVEGAVFLVGTWLYLRSTSAKDRVGRWGPRILLAILVLLYA